MTRKKLYMVIESVLCVLTAGALALEAILMYVRGSAIQTSGDLFYYIYTREKVGAALMHVLPLIIVLAVFTIAGWFMGIRDEKADQPAASWKMPGKQPAGKQTSEIQTDGKAAPLRSGRWQKVLRISILILAVLLIILGVINGGMEDVLTKGASVCTECIGLG